MTKVFTTKTCAYCPSVKKYLKSFNHEYEEVDCTEDLNLIKEVSNITGVYSTPQTLFDNGFTVVGLNYAKLKKGIENGRD